MVRVILLKQTCFKVHGKTGGVMRKIAFATQEALPNDIILGPEYSLFNSKDRLNKNDDNSGTHYSLTSISLEKNV